LKRTLRIPDEVKASISAHIRGAVANAKDGYLSAHEDEDTLTGHLGGALRTNKHKVDVPMDQREMGGIWEWSVNYYKFKGRGKDASEKFLGADGVFEINLSWPYGTEKKSLLFQSKKEWLGKDASLFRQCIRLSTWREAAFVLNYTLADFEAFPVDEVIRARGSRANVPLPDKLEIFLSDDFLDCLIGDTDLVYDPQSHRLHWRASSGEIVATKFRVGHRISINVEAPKHDTNKRGYRDVTNEEIHNYRMQADEEEMLGLKPHYTQQDVKAAQRSLSLAYHPDKHPGADELLTDILNRRMQEFNSAADRVYANLERKT
jgi:hypothetical protein